MMMLIALSGCQSKQNRTCENNREESKANASSVGYISDNNTNTLAPAILTYDVFQYPRFQSLFNGLEYPFFAWSAIDPHNLQGTVLFCLFEDGTVIWNSFLEQSMSTKQDNFFAPERHSDVFYISHIEKDALDNFIELATKRHAWKLNARSMLAAGEMAVYTIYFRNGNCPDTILFSNISPAYTNMRFYSIEENFFREWIFFVETSKSMITSQKKILAGSSFTFVRGPLIVHEGESPIICDQAGDIGKEQ